MAIPLEMCTINVLNDTKFGRSEILKFYRDVAFGVCSLEKEEGTCEKCKIVLNLSLIEWIEHESGIWYRGHCLGWREGVGFGHAYYVRIRE